MPIRALSLDLFDTLVDLRFEPGATARTSAHSLHAAVAAHRDLDFEAFAEALRAVDRESRKMRYAEGLEVATEDRFACLLERLGIDHPDLAEELTRIHMGVIRSCVVVPEHHDDLLRELREHVQIGLCSNFSHAPTAHSILEEAGLRGRLDAVAISVDVGVRKPRREIFEAVLSGLCAAPEDTLHVGDNLHADVAGAASFGMRTAWITRRVADPDATLAGFEGPRPDFVLADLRELLPLVADPARV
jgi:FMN phosphatase YigB (HAD superfamily)